MNIKFVLIGIAVIIGSIFYWRREWRLFSNKLKREGPKSLVLFNTLLDFLFLGGTGAAIVLFLIGFLILGNGLSLW